jgi:hypothetical protein
VLYNLLQLDVTPEREGAVSHNGWWLRRRGRSSPANARGLDTHRDSISSRFDCRCGKTASPPAAPARRGAAPSVWWRAAPPAMRCGGRCAPFGGAVWTEIYLGNVCSCQEILRRNGRG